MRTWLFLLHLLPCCAIALLWLPSAPLCAQDADADVPVAADGISFIPSFDFLFPAVYRIGDRTRQWVRDSLPATDSVSDLDRLDAIWLRALQESDGNTDRAIFATLMAVFEHRTIPFTFGLHLPLTLEPMEDFRKRYAHLPAHLFADQPAGHDQDKLQHFFASAWIARNIDNRSIADLFGLGVEVGEDMFIRGGMNDPRDMRANRLGQDFAMLLRRYPDALPSAMFRAWNREYLRRGGK